MSRNEVKLFRREPTRRMIEASYDASVRRLLTEPEWYLGTSEEDQHELCLRGHAESLRAAWDAAETDWDALKGELPTDPLVLADQMRAHVINRGGVSRDAEGNAIIPNGAWAMMLAAAEVIERLCQSISELETELLNSKLS